MLRIHGWITFWKHRSSLQIFANRVTLGRFYFACQFSLCFVPLRPALGARGSCLFFERTGSAARRLAAAECTGRRSCINTSWCRSHPHQQPNFVNKLMYFTPFSQIFSCLKLSIVNDQVLHIFIFLVSVPFLFVIINVRILFSKISKEIFS